MSNDNGYKPVGFNNATRQTKIPINGLVYSANNTSTVQLPEVGFLSRIVLNVVANITTSNGSSDAFSLDTASGWPDPFKLIQRVRLYTNQGSEVVNLTGAGLYMFNRIIRGYDIRNLPAVLQAATDTASIYSAPATPAKNTTYNVVQTHEIPVAWGPQLQAGLILLQDPTKRMSLDVTFGNAATQTITIGTGTVTVNSVSVSAVMEVYQIPDHPEDYPAMTLCHRVLEETVPIVSTGQFYYKPNLGGVFLDVIEQHENNSARMTVSDVTNLYFKYAQTQNPYNLPSWMAVYEGMKLGNGRVLPNGVYWWPFDQNYGDPILNGVRDVYDTSKLTDLEMISQISPSTSLVSAQLRVVRRELVKWLA